MRTRVVYEDREILVCYKPAGLAVQTAIGFQEDVVSELKNYLSRKNNKAEPYLGIVHRLDQPVEGLLVFAKTKKAADGLTRQLADGRLEKKYLAVLWGVPEARQGVLIDYLKKDGRAGRANVVSENEPAAKRAELCYRILQEAEVQAGMGAQAEIQKRRFSLAEITIKTGRFHQIRAQMSHLGHPLFGDMKYGAKEKGQLALCASQLAFVNPLDGKKQKFCCKPQNPVFAQFTQGNDPSDPYGNSALEGGTTEQ